jgi:hypothetical protein
MHRPCVGFLHGTGGHPAGSKGAWLSQRYELWGPNYATDGSLDDAVKTVVAYMETWDASGAAPPAVLVGSSWGGALLWRLMQLGHWTGPAIFLAPAFSLASEFDSMTTPLPTVSPVWLLHGWSDDVVAVEESLTFCRLHPHARLLTAGWSHRLQEVLDDGTLQLVLDQVLSTTPHSAFPASSTDRA